MNPFDYAYELNKATTEALHKTRIGALQENSNRLFENGVVSNFEVKMGTFLKQKAILNFEREIECLIEFEAMKEKIINSNSRSIKCAPNIISTGDYITHIPDYQDKSEERTYIIRNSIDHKRGYDSAYLLLCQQTLKFLDLNGNIVEFPVAFDNVKTRMAESFEKSAILDDAATYECYIQDNEHTNRICCTDENAMGGISRFIIKGRAYKVIGVDNLSMNGIIYIKLKGDKVGPLDNVKLQVADYYRLISKDEEIVPDPKDFIIEGEDKILIDDEDSIYTINADESKGEIVDWTITTLKGVHMVVDSNNSVRIRVDNDLTLKGKYIELKATINQVDYTKKIKIVNW